MFVNFNASVRWYFAYFDLMEINHESHFRTPESDPRLVSRTTTHPQSLYSDDAITSHTPILEGW